MLNTDEPSDSSSGQWNVVGSSSEVGEKQGVEFLVGTDVIAVFRQEGKLYAVDGICAHQGGPIAKGSLDKTCVTCPWHGWQYNIGTGENLLTKRKMLRTFDIREVDGKIEIQVPVN
jgi:nitrite reductase/ring-hydroxylating ferredoxin subunit